MESHRTWKLEPRQPAGWCASVAVTQRTAELRSLAQAIADALPSRVVR
jgi:hypothetical protein